MVCFVSSFLDSKYSFVSETISSFSFILKIHSTKLSAERAETGLTSCGSFPDIHFLVCTFLFPFVVCNFFTLRTFQVTYSRSHASSSKFVFAVVIIVMVCSF